MLEVPGRSCVSLFRSHLWLFRSALSEVCQTVRSYDLSFSPFPLDLFSPFFWKIDFGQHHAGCRFKKKMNRSVSSYEDAHHLWNNQERKVRHFQLVYLEQRIILVLGSCRPLMLSRYGMEFHQCQGYLATTWEDH